MSSDSLVMRGTSHFVHPILITQNQARRSGFSQIYQITRTLILPIGIQINFPDAVRMLPQTAGNGMKAENIVRAGHDG